MRSKKIPSSCESWLPRMLSATGSIVIRIMRSTSCFMCRLGILMPPVASMAMPATRVRSAMLLPITVPKLRTGVLASAEVMPTNNSGMLVDTARMVKPVMNALKWRNAEILVIDFTSRNPEIISVAQETKNVIIVKMISIK